MRGFTIIETVVSFLILSVIIMAIFLVAELGNLSWKTDTGMFELRQQARLGMSRILHLVRQAKNINKTVIDDNDDRLDFDTPSGTGHAIYRDIFDLNNNRLTTELIYEYPSGSRRILAQDITYLKFTQSGNTTTVSLAASKMSSGKTLSFPLTEKVLLRN